MTSLWIIKFPLIQISTKWMSSWNPFKTFNLLQNSYQSRATSIPRHFSVSYKKVRHFENVLLKLQNLIQIKVCSNLIIHRPKIVHFTNFSISFYCPNPLQGIRRLCKYLGLFTILSSTLLGTTTEDAVALRGRAFQNIKDISALIVMECGKLSYEALTWLLCFRFR